MGAAQRDGHPPDAERDRIATAHDPAMRNADLGPDIDAEGAEPLRLFIDQQRPIDRGNAGALANGEKIESHRFGAAIVASLLQVVRNNLIEVKKRSFETAT
jgi:hypothetical protein